MTAHAADFVPCTEGAIWNRALNRNITEYCNAPVSHAAHLLSLICAGPSQLVCVVLGTQHSFCKAHMSALGPEAVAAACGLDGPGNLFPNVVPGAVDSSTVQMIAYKPGASQLPTYWSTPHRSGLATSY